MNCMEQYDEQKPICPYCGYDEHTEEISGPHMMPGEILQERYIVGVALGIGGFGVTYIGWDALLERKVAIKEYMPSELASRSVGVKEITIYAGKRQEYFRWGLQKFREEAQKLAKLNQISGIVQIYDTFEENRTAYIIMELLKGETLADYLETKNHLSFEKTMHILLPIAEALREVHAIGLIHRDIAPDNIFLTNDGKVKLIDFGAARSETGVYSHSLSVLVKQGYSPEEQYRSQGEQGTYTDIYALGAVFYKCLTGETPPNALERRACVENSKQDCLKPISDFTKEIPYTAEKAIYQAMRIYAKERTKTAAELIHQLTAEDHLNTVKVEETPPEPPVKNTISVKKMIIVLLVVVLLVALVWVIQHWHQSKSSKIESTESSTTELETTEPSVTKTVPNETSVPKTKPTEPKKTDSLYITGTVGAIDWKLNEKTGQLQLEGTGEMENFAECSDQPWEEYQKQITSLTIGEGITSIGENAFNSGRVTVADSNENLNTALSVVKFSDSVTKIGDHAFWGTNLKVVELPNQLETIGNGAFSYCFDLSEITIPDSVTEIGDYAFCATGLKEITIPSGITSIGEAVFNSCSDLTKVIIPQNVTSIQTKAFGTCPQLADITIENPDCAIVDDAETISETAVIHGYPDSTAQAYAEKYNRSFVKIGETVTNTVKNITWTWDADSGALTISGNGDMPEWNAIEETPWYNFNKNIRSVVIEEGITSVGRFSFQSAYNLEEVKLADSISKIGAYGFQGCIALPKIKLPDSLKVLGEWSFSDCIKLAVVTIPEQTEKIELGAFDYCDNLKSVRILNPACEIIDEEESYTFSNGDNNGRYFNGKLYGEIGSSTESYAKQHGMQFSTLTITPATPATLPLPSLSPPEPFLL